MFRLAFDGVATLIDVGFLLRLVVLGRVSALAMLDLGLEDLDQAICLLELF